MSHYSDDTPLEPFLITVQFGGKPYQFTSSKGVFSKDALDNGTQLLIENAEMPQKARVLDLGCGIGVVGIFVKLLYPHTTVVQSDVTQKAVHLTRQNAKLHKVETTVALSNVYEKIEGKFDVILTNPPRAAGKKVIEQMIVGAFERLNSQGSLQLVALTNKGGKSYEAMMKETFGNVETIARGSGFKVYKSVKQ